MNELKEKLDTLCIFRDLLQDSVISALQTYFEFPSSSAYAEFVSKLYRANGGNLGEHIKDICSNSENVYVKMLGQGKSVPHFMYQTLLSELDVLQELTELTDDDLRMEIAYDGSLPEFTTTTLRLKDICLHRTENIAEFGFGIYATSNRRHIIKETFSDREGDDIHRNDTMQELISLSERFGIHVTFSKPNKETFLHIVHHLAEENGVDMPADELDLLAERFALERGGRSARLAKQFIDGILAK